MSGRVWLAWVILLLCAAIPHDGYAADAGHWMTGHPAPTARTEVAAAALDGVMYVVGGFEPSSLWTMWRSSVSARVETYNPATNRWAAASDLPVGLHHAGAVVVDGALYVVGGFTQSDDTIWLPSARVFRFNAARDTWEERAPLPTARGGLAVTTLRGGIVAVGGYDGKDNPAAVEVYDPGRDVWTTAAPLPTPRDHLAAVTVGDVLYAIGGRVRLDYRHNLSTVEAYHADRDAWVSVADMPSPRSGIAAARVGAWIYVFGGESGAGTFAHNERYAPQGNRWEAMAPMPTARHGLGAVAVEGRVYVVTGGPRPGGSYSALNEIFLPPTSTSMSTSPMSPTSPMPPLSPMRSGRTPSAHVGAVMAVLATADDAGVLPPESDPEATQLIHALIQYQSVVRTRVDGARNVLVSALAEKFEATRAATLAGDFAVTGWTSETLEALVDDAARRSTWAEPRWADVLRGHNVTAADWALIERVFLQARARLRERGKNIHAVFAAHRASMPGGRR